MAEFWYEHAHQSPFSPGIDTLSRVYEDAMRDKAKVAVISAGDSAATNGVPPVLVSTNHASTHPSSMFTLV